MSTSLQLGKKGVHRCLEGHPWIYEGEIGAIKGQLSPAKAVAVRDAEGHLIGSAIYSPQSMVRARLISRQKTEITPEWIRDRIRAAADLRAGLDTCRVVWAEADGLPGLIVDRYGTCAVLQILHAAWELRRAEILDAIRDTLGVDTIIERSDVTARDHEGLPRRTEVCLGSYTPPSAHRIGLATFELNLLQGQKTGAYLDQADNYRRVAARAPGKRVLDCFANAGGFAIHCALAGAASVEAVESSLPTIEEGKRNAALNGVTVEWHPANVFEFLRAAARENRVCDLIILDPPAFTKSRAKIAEAMRGYREIHVRALHLLAPGGILATYSCSHHIPMHLLEESARIAAGDARRSARIIERHHQSQDHPVILAMPESEYLKGLVLQVD